MPYRHDRDIVDAAALHERDKQVEQIELDQAFSELSGNTQFSLKI